MSTVQALPSTASIRVYTGSQRGADRGEAAEDKRLIGLSVQMAEACRLIEKAARTPFPVLLLGESGTGKEVAAREIHRTSARADKPFVVIDCGSLVSTLVESELFGHVRGAFSGAVVNKVGLVETAEGGTIFLDEIGDLPLEMQVKLLRLLQEREFRPVGALYGRGADVRFIAATNRDLTADIAAGRFRMDLYQRLNVFPVRLPPLRSRREDVPALARHFMRRMDRLGLTPIPLDDEKLRVLCEHSWPGNVRELEHCIERMVILGVESVEDLRKVMLQGSAEPAPSNPPAHAAPDCDGGRAAPSVMSIPEGELQLISAALDATGGNRAKAAEILKISRTTLYRRMRDCGVRARSTQSPGRSTRATGRLHVPAR